MGSFSWLKADELTNISNITYGMPFKFLIPKEFGGGYIKDHYQDYGRLGTKEDGTPKYDGKSQYIELAINISYVNTYGETVNCEHEAIGNKAIAFVGTSGVQMGWLASQADMLAEDWIFA